MERITTIFRNCGIIIFESSINNKHTDPNNQGTFKTFLSIISVIVQVASYEIFDIFIFPSFQINLVIFILALRSALFSSVVNKTAKATAATALRKAKVGLKGSAVLLPLLGLTWVFGLLVFNRDTIVFKYLFAICNSLQGVMIFVFHVLIDRKVCLALVLGLLRVCLPYPPDEEPFLETSN